MLLEKSTLVIFPKEETIMKNTDSKTVLEMFTKTVDNLVQSIDAEILSCEYSDAEDATARMQEVLNGIVNAMEKRNHCTPCEAAMINSFIDYIVADKKKIISGKRYIRSLEYHVNNSAFKEEEAKWKDYVTPPFDEETHQAAASNNSHKNKWAYDDDEDDL